MHPILKLRQNITRIPLEPLVALCCALIVLAYVMGRNHDKGPQGGSQTISQTEIHFAPEENLENVDIPLINGARKAVDVAVYTFTDRKLADALVTAAGRGVQVRIYRDREQFQSEQNRGGQVLAILSHQPNIEIKVKASRDLMHDKAFEVDNRILRDGSGNWSLSAAHYQDNEIRVTDNPLEVNAFEQTFSAMWSRTDNEVIQ
jgi:phosphatidylserine/phosphatidylglycerophosphate/cardiolipin synthase-like enzyme